MKKKLLSLRFSQVNPRNQALNKNLLRATFVHQLQEEEETAEALETGLTHKQGSCIVCFVEKTKVTPQRTATEQSKRERTCCCYYCPTISAEKNCSIQLRTIHPTSHKVSNTRTQRFHLANPKMRMRLNTI